MRNFLLRLLCLFVAVLLCINFIRFVLIPSNGEYKTVSVMSFLDALSNVGADAEPIFNDVGALVNMTADVMEEFSSIFDTDYTGGDAVLKVIVNFFQFMYDLIKTAIIEIGGLLHLTGELFIFIKDLLQSLFQLFNALFDTGFTVNTVPAPIGGDGYSGGGFGGRR